MILSGFQWRLGSRQMLWYLLLFVFFNLTGCNIKVDGTLDKWREINHPYRPGSKKDSDIMIFHFTGHYNPTASTSVTSKPIAEDLIPDFNKLIMVVKQDGGSPPGGILKVSVEAVAKALGIPVEHIKVAKFNASTGLLKLYFINGVSGSSRDIVLVPASNVYPYLSIEKVQREAKNVRILGIQIAGKFVPQKGPENDMSHLLSNKQAQVWQMAVIISCSLFGLFCVALIVLFLSTRNSPKEPRFMAEERQVVVQPVLKPDASEINVIQPENKDCYIAETDSEHTPSPCHSPLRMKGKGLLERRGSNASLTLDLNRSQENIHCGTPPKECSTEEFLMSAGHRLTRKQLRNVLKDVKFLHTQFWEIPMNHPERVEVAGSGTKNRYKTILPNELSRVQIRSNDADPLSAYINANYVRGYANEQHAYIATQGPMAHTVDDFWNMVMEEKSPIIVMITKLKEKLKVKCEPYVPDYRGKYGGIGVTVKKVLPRDGYTIRELHLTNGHEGHRVYHVWYTAWPDHKTPNTAKQLLAMALEVETLRHNSNGTTKGPTVVHCSAGIGRTGCFIAVSIGIQQLLEENVVDILGIVCSLRLDRGGMVQTAEQYEFVHQSLSVFEASMPDQSGV